jgi:hypothetical protein
MVVQNDQRVPYATELTPRSLGRMLGHDAVLPWLLQTAETVGTRKDFRNAIIEKCFSHIQGKRAQQNRCDMASHVLQGLMGYKLVEIGAGDSIALTAKGEELLSVDDDVRDILFARHILTACNGYRLVEAIRRYELRGEVPSLEDLASELDGHPTAKSVSSMRAWLARAGVISASGRYTINKDALDRVLGGPVDAALGLTQVELEFLISARVLTKQRNA